MQLNQHIQDFVRVYDDILSEDLCDKIIKEYRNNEYLPAETGNGLSPENRNVDEIPICLPDHCNNNERLSIVKSLHEGMEKVIKQYEATFYPYFHIDMDTGFQLLRYKTGHYYKEHVDTFRPVMDQALINAILDMRLKPQDLLKFHGSGQRAISCSILLNDEFEGGQLGFWNNTFKPIQRKGTIVVFPSNFMYPHQVSEITKGTRYAIVTWLI